MKLGQKEAWMDKKNKKPRQPGDSAADPKKKYSAAPEEDRPPAFILEPAAPPPEAKSLNLKIRDAYTAVFVFAAIAVLLVIWEVEIITRTIVREGYEQSAVSGFVMKGENIPGLIENDELTKLLKVCICALFPVPPTTTDKPAWRTGRVAGLRDDSDSPVSALLPAADRVRDSEDR